MNVSIYESKSYNKKGDISSIVKVSLLTKDFETSLDKVKFNELTYSLQGNLIL